MLYPVCFVMFFSCVASQQDNSAPVEFFVTVPKDTDAAAKLYLAGDLDVVGDWKADGVPLERLADGRYFAKVALPKGSVLEYKITQGSWQTVEKDARGGEVANRELWVAGPAKVEIAVQSWSSPASQPAAGGEARKSTLTGDIRYHHNFKSKHLGNQRTLVVYLPPGYKGGADQRYAVLYMHDGQNIFDAATSFIGVEWQADEHAERLIKAGRIEPIIIVGVYNNGDRANEYTPWPDKTHGAGGRGGLYARFLVEEVKPFIDQEYRTLPGREDTAVAGSSLGGLISLYASIRHPEVFSKCGAVSPALMWADGRFFEDARRDSARLKKVKFWLDMGTAEERQIPTFSRAIKNTRELVTIFDDAGLVPGRDYYYWEVYEGEHNEAHWAARFDRLLLYFYYK